jgi:hypothetical protein
MVTIYDFIERGWLTEAHANIDKLDRAIGGDPYLQLLHARAFIEAGELVRAKKILNEPFDSAAVNIKAHWLLVSASLKEKEFETTANLLSKLRDELGEELADLTQVPAYSEFVKSPQYLKWINGAVKR